MSWFWPSLPHLAIYCNETASIQPIDHTFLECKLKSPSLVTIPAPAQITYQQDFEGRWNVHWCRHQERRLSQVHFLSFHLPRPSRPPANWSKLSKASDLNYDGYPNPTRAKNQIIHNVKSSSLALSESSMLGRIPQIQASIPQCCTRNAHNRMRVPFPIVVLLNNVTGRTPSKTWSFTSNIMIDNFHRTDSRPS